MKKNTTIWFFVMLVFVLPVAAYAVMNWYESRIERLPVLGPVTEHNGKKETHTIGDFLMTDQDGRKVSTADWGNKIVVADFFFTHCPSVCPKLTNHLKKIQESFQNDTQLLFNSFSVDPVRDSVAELKKYTDRFGLDTRNWHLLTGDKKKIYQLARNSFMVVATDGDGGPQDFIHSEKLVLIDKRKQIRGYYSGTDEAEVNKLIQDIKKLKNEE